MKFQQLRILADENISPKIVAFLRKEGLDILDTKEQGWQGRNDDELLDIAQKDKRWVLTHDSDFGTLAIHEGRPYHGIIFLRVSNLQPYNVISVCKKLLQHKADFIQSSLIVVEESRLRIRQPGRE